MARRVQSNVAPSLQPKSEPPMKRHITTILNTAVAFVALVTAVLWIGAALRKN